MTTFTVSYPNKLQRIRMAAQRASLLLRCHAAYMVRAERSFANWQAPGTTVERETHWCRYQVWSAKAAMMHTRHRRLVARILAQIVVP